MVSARCGWRLSRPAVRAWRVAWIGVVASPVVAAATLTIHVVAPDGQPAAGVVVEVVSPGATRSAAPEPVVTAGKTPRRP